MKRKGNPITLWLSSRLFMHSRANPKSSRGAAPSLERTESMLAVLVAMMIDFVFDS